MRRRIVLALTVAAFSACTLNPQPLPPGPDTNPETPGESKATSPFADAGYLADAAGATLADDASTAADAGTGDGASPPPGGDASADAADARADARDATGD